MKKMKPLKEKPGLKRFELTIYFGNNKEVTRRMVAFNHEIAGENLMRSMNLQFKRDNVMVIGSHQLGSAY